MHHAAPRTAARLRAAASFMSLVVAACTLPQPAVAQQFVTDDAFITESRACQLEAWHGETSSWLQPACHFVRPVELMLGAGSVAGDDGRSTQYVLQAKAQLREPRTGGIGYGFVAGLGHDPQAQVRGGVVSLFAHVPVTASLAADALLLHVNAGWHHEYADHGQGRVHEDDDHGHHAFTWALRADATPRLADGRIAFIAELFGENGTRPEFQLGLRGAAVAERLLVAVSWGGHTRSGQAGAGWTAGFTWTPPPLGQR